MNHAFNMCTGNRQLYDDFVYIDKMYYERVNWIQVKSKRQETRII